MDDINECNPSCVEKIALRSGNADFDVDIISSMETNIITSEKKHNIRATGLYSDLEVVFMSGFNSFEKLRSHFGLILKQEKQWILNNASRKCLLFHHMGDRIEMAVGCIDCLRKCVRDAYGSEEVKKPIIKCYNYGRSSAAVFRFLGEDSLGRNKKYGYNSAYAHSDKFYEWQTTNCLRLVFDMLVFLLLDYKLAISFIIDNVGNNKWGEFFITLVEKYPDFVKSIEIMWKDMKGNNKLTKLCEKIDQQYYLNGALLLLSFMKLKI